jgi:hypothetical protein
MAGSRPAPAAGQVNRTRPQEAAPATTAPTPVSTVISDPFPVDNWTNWDQTVRKQTGRVTDGNKWFNVEVVAPPK